MPKKKVNYRGAAASIADAPIKVTTVPKVLPVAEVVAKSKRPRSMIENLITDGRLTAGYIFANPKIGYAGMKVIVQDELLKKFYSDCSLREQLK